MVEKVELKGRVQEKQPVIWISGTSPKELGGKQFPRTTIFKDRALVAEVEGKEIGVGVFALPPEETTGSRFWNKIKGAVGMKSEDASKQQPVRLRIEPRIPLDEYKKEEQTPISAVYPYVVMEDGTTYGIGVWIPRNMVGQWSETKKRLAGEVFSQYEEKYRERNSIALLVRVDGEHPLAEREEPGYVVEPKRHELLFGVHEPKAGSEGDIFVSITERIVDRKGGREKFSELGETIQQKAEISDLVFHSIAKAGTEENAKLDNKGLVQVVVLKVVDDEIIEKIHEPVILPNMQEGQWGAEKGLRSFGYKGIQKGETRFENKRNEKVSIRTVRGATPIAVIDFALVGHGGLVNAEMTEAPKSA